jgi:hypothetical protein
MKKLTQPELYSAIRKYLRNRERLLDVATSSVKEWKFADQPMYSPTPLFDVVERGSKQWKAARRRWLKKKPASFWYKHGIDESGNIRIVESSNGFITLFTYSGNSIDEMRFGGVTDLRGTSLRRYLLKNNIVESVYGYCLDPHQYHHERFYFEGDRYVKSVKRGWLVTAYRPGRNCTPAKAQLSAASFCQQLRSYGIENSRIVLCAPIDSKHVMDFLKETDIDGILLEDSTFTDVLSILSQIAIHC